MKNSFKMKKEEDVGCIFKVRMSLSQSVLCIHTYEDTGGDGDELITALILTSNTDAAVFLRNFPSKVKRETVNLETALPPD